MTILFPVKIVYNIYKQEKAEENGILNFEWDEDKNQLNLKKHGIDFETAMLVFNDLHRIEIYDMEHSINEDHYNTIGLENLVNIAKQLMQEIAIIDYSKAA